MLSLKKLQFVLSPIVGWFWEFQASVFLHAGLESSFCWELMQPEGGGLPEGGVLQHIEKDFGSFTNFREEFIRSALQLLGYGWVWLVCKFLSIFFEVQTPLVQTTDFLNCSF
jgi:superoxide dismutase